MSERVYLDYNGGAPLRPEARAAVADALDRGGNASSVHAEGRDARRIIEEARENVAALVGADPRNVTFVSGGTEANVTVLSPAVMVEGRSQAIDRLFVGATEHPSVLAGGRFAKDVVEQISVDRDGRIDLEGLASRLDEAAARGERALVSVMLANNETGAIQPVSEVVALARQHGALVHTDAAQAIGRMPVDIALGADFLTLSAHKIGGPQGVGAVVQRSRDTAPTPILRGGGQESRRRAGTENVAAIAGFGAASGAVLRDLAAADRWRAWRDRLATAVAGFAGVTIFSDGVVRLPQTLCLGFRGVSAETLVIGLDLEGVAVSSGSACSSGKVGPSHVLAAMGVASDVARGAVRISFGWATEEKDLDRFQTALRRVLERVRAAGDERAA